MRIKQLVNINGRRRRRGRKISPENWFIVSSLVFVISFDSLVVCSVINERFHSLFRIIILYFLVVCIDQSCVCVCVDSDLFVYNFVFFFRSSNELWFSNSLAMCPILSVLPLVIGSVFTLGSAECVGKTHLIQFCLNCSQILFSLSLSLSVFDDARGDRDSKKFVSSSFEFIHSDWI